MIQCTDCRNWIKTVDNPNWGECRKNAPLPKVGSAGAFISPEIFRAIWPYSRDVDGCSEGVFAVRQEVEEAPQMDTPSRMEPNSLFNKAVVSSKGPGRSFGDIVEAAKREVNGAN